jgi:hypothetical protein
MQNQDTANSELWSRQETDISKPSAQKETTISELYTQQGTIIYKLSAKQGTNNMNYAHRTQLFLNYVHNSEQCNVL